MSSTIIARFHDPQEAHIAAGALVAHGFDATVHDINLGLTNPLMRQAIGGFPLIVPAGQANDALVYLNSLRAPKPEEALNWKKHPKVVSGMVWAPIAFIQPEIAMAMVGLKSGSARKRFWVALGVISLYALLFASVVYGAFFAFA